MINRTVIKITNITKKSWPIVVVCLVGIIIGLKVVFSSDILAAGYDSTVHLYKVEILSEQIEELQNPLLWGSWDWNWYNGYPFLKMYPSLFYFLSSIPIVLFDVTEGASMNFIVATLFPLIGISGYLVAYQITKNKMASIIGGVVYCSLPSLISTVTITGRLANLPAFLFAPLIVFFHNKMLKEQKLNHFQFFIAIILIPTLLLSHPYTLVTLIPYLIIITIINRIMCGKFRSASIIFLLIGLAVSIFWIMAFLEYVNFAGFYPSPEWSVNNITLFAQVERIIGILGLGPIAFTFFIVSMIMCFRRKDTNIMPYVLCSIFALIPFLLVILVPDVEKLLIFRIISGLAPLETFTPIIAAYSFLIIRSECLKFKVQSFKLHEININKKTIITVSLVLIIGLQTYLLPTIPRNFSEFDPEIDAGIFLNEYKNEIRTLAIYETFDNLSQWNSDERSIANGRLVIETDTEPAYIVTPIENTNFTLEMDFQWEKNDSIGIGAVFGYLDDNNLYQLRWLDQWKVVKLEKKIDGKYVDIESYCFDLQNSLSNGTWHKMKIHLKENLIEVFVDNRFLFKVVESNLIQGKIGLTVANGKGMFDNLKIYSIEHGEEEWSRFWLIPRHPSMGLVSIESKMSSFDGWFDEGSPFEIQYFIHRMVETDMDIINNPNATLNALRIFNVRFVILNTNRFWLPFAGNESRIVDNLRHSSYLDLIYEKEGLLIFELQETFSTMASTNVFTIDELSTVYEIVSNPSFNATSGIFQSADNENQSSLHKKWDDNSKQNEKVELTINHIDAGSNMKFDLYVDKDCYISLPISPYPNLKVEIDGEETGFFEVLPAFIGIKVPKGRHSIVVTPTLTDTEKNSILVSAAAFILLLSYTAISIYLNRNTQTKFLKNKKD